MFKKRLKLLEYHMVILWNNKKYIPEGFVIDFISPTKNIWSFTYVWGTIGFDFNKYEIIDIVPNTCMFGADIGIKWFSEWLEDYYQMRYHQIYYLFGQIYNYAQTHKTKLQITKIGDKYRLLNFYDDPKTYYDVWITSKSKYAFKSHNDERIRDLRGFIEVVNEKFNKS